MMTIMVLKTIYKREDNKWFLEKDIKLPDKIFLDKNLNQITNDELLCSFKDDCII